MNYLCNNECYIALMILQAVLIMKMRQKMENGKISNSLIMNFSLVNELNIFFLWMFKIGPWRYRMIKREELALFC